MTSLLARPLISLDLFWAGNFKPWILLRCVASAGAYAQCSLVLQLGVFRYVIVNNIFMDSRVGSGQRDCLPISCKRVLTGALFRLEQAVRSSAVGVKACGYLSSL